MGNRAVITTNKNLNEVGVYLHWNGGRDSVEAFLAYCNLKKYRKPENDCYGWVMLANVISNYFGDGCSCGVDKAHRLDCDNYDNGVYIIKDWYIVDRLFSHGEDYYYDLKDMLKEIDATQPERMRLTAEEWGRFDEVKEETLKHRVKNLEKS